MKIHATVTCEKCGEPQGDIELGPQQCGELKTAKKIGTFLGEVAVIFIRQALEHECKGDGKPW